LNEWLCSARIVLDLGFEKAESSGLDPVEYRRHDPIGEDLKKVAVVGIDGIVDVEPCAEPGRGRANGKRCCGINRDLDRERLALASTDAVEINPPSSEHEIRMDFLVVARLDEAAGNDLQGDALYFLVSAAAFDYDVAGQGITDDDLIAVENCIDAGAPNADGA
jgi:hypothetical protein